MQVNTKDLSILPCISFAVCTDHNPQVIPTISVNVKNTIQMLIFKSYKSGLLKPNIHSQTIKYNNKNDKHKSNCNTEIMSSILMPNVDVKSSKTNKTSTNCKVMIIDNITDFTKNCVVINADCKNNIHFKYLSHNVASYLCSNILFNNKFKFKQYSLNMYPIILALISVLTYGASSLFQSDNNNNDNNNNSNKIIIFVFYYKVLH